MKRTFMWNVVYRKLSSSAWHVPLQQLVSASNNSYVNFGLCVFKFMSFFMWSYIVDLDTPNSAHHFNICFWGNAPLGRKQLHVWSSVFSFTHSTVSPWYFWRESTHFFQSSNVTFCGSALLNGSWNTIVSLTIVCTVHDLWCIHMLAINHSSTEYMLLLAIIRTLSNYALQACPTDSVATHHFQSHQVFTLAHRHFLS